MLLRMTQGNRRTLGFLFADLRGYTAFVERQGDAAAADLLHDYRQLVREAVAAFGGAEIKTEGDSFYVVFQSASSAVECGLALVEEAADATSRRPERPIHVGVGVHAGDTVETDEGYIGSAVNVAARVCSVARAGEVAVTATVYGLVRTALAVHFVPRGTPRLKGIDQPIAIYAVKRGPASTPAGWRRVVRRQSGRGAGLLAAGAVVALAASLGGVVLFGSAPPSPSPGDSAHGSIAVEPLPQESATASGGITTVTASEIEASNEHSVDLPRGAYQLPEVRPPMSFEIASGDWEIDRIYPDGFNLFYRRSPESELVDGYVSGGVVQVVLNGPCRESPTQAIGPEPEALVAWLQANEWLTVTDPRPVNLGGWTGLQVDVSQAKNPAGSCEPPPSEAPSELVDTIEQQVYIFLFGADNFWIAPDERVRMLIVDVGGRSFTILAGVLESSGFEGFLEAALPTLESIRFSTP